MEKGETMYSNKIMLHFLHPKFHKKIKKFNAVGQVGNVQCGDVMKLYLFVEKNIIKDISFETLGCMAAIASSDVLCGLAKGRNIDDAFKITGKDVVAELGEVPELKIHCSVLAQAALKKAIIQYRKKTAELKSKGKK